MIPDWIVYFMIASLLASVVVLSACMAAGSADEMRKERQRAQKPAPLQRNPLRFRQKLVT
ncbi:MAG: hypothetical protein KDE19_07640 [Caldilineaceae bacterium]|nr:hypothetical protein [Caldilineaceae bacterium]